MDTSSLPSQWLLARHTATWNSYGSRGSRGLASHSVTGNAFCSTWKSRSNSGEHWKGAPLFVSHQCFPYRRDWSGNLSISGRYPRIYIGNLSIVPYPGIIFDKFKVSYLYCPCSPTTSHLTRNFPCWSQWFINFNARQIITNVRLWVSANLADMVDETVSTLRISAVISQCR